MNAVTSATFKAVGAANSVKKFAADLGSSPQNPDGTIKGEVTDKYHEAVKAPLMDLVGIAGLSSSVATLVLTDGHIVDLASYSTAVIAPYTSYQKHRLKKLGGLRGNINILRQKVNELHEENNVLSGSIDNLESQVTVLEDVESQLVRLCKDANTSMDRLMSIVKRNGEIQAQIKKNLERQVIFDVVGIVVTADRDRDFSLSDMELNTLVMRMNGLQGVKFDEANFRKMIPKAPVPLAKIFDVLRNLCDDNVAEKDNVFHLKPEELRK